MVLGMGTSFTTDLRQGDIVVITGAETHPIMVRSIMNDFLFEAYQTSPLDIPIPGIAYSVRDAEHEYIFRGLIEDKQVLNIDHGILRE